MKKTIIATLVLAGTASFALAQAPDSDSSLTGKAMKGQPGTTGAAQGGMSAAISRLASSVRKSTSAVRGTYAPVSLVRKYVENSSDPRGSGPVRQASGTTEMVSVPLVPDCFFCMSVERNASNRATSLSRMRYA